MYQNATIKVYARTLTTNSEGTRIETWGMTPIDTFRADVQPKNLTEAERELYGIVEHNANVKVLYGKSRASLVSKYRAFVTTDGGGGEVKYTIQPCNYWPNHIEVLLIPVIGEV